MNSGRADRLSRMFEELCLKPLATAGFFVLLAFLWTLLLQRTFAYPFLFLFFGAVAGGAWFGGTIAGFATVIGSALTVAYFFVPPLYSWHVDPTARSYFIAFIVCASIVSWVSSAKKRSETAIRDARDQLEHRVFERTAELERSYAEVQERERRLRLLTEAIPQQIWSAGANGDVEYCNQHLLAYIGRTMGEMRAGGYFEAFHPEDREGFCQLRQASFAAGHRFEAECRIAGANGQHRWFLVRGMPQRSADGEVVRWYGTHIEIEERHRAEQALAAAQAELSGLSRKLSMGELAASIMHEINQPLTAVVTHAYACREWLRGSPSNMEKACLTAERIVEESTRASTVAARVRALFQKESPAKQRVDMNRLIRNLVRILRDESIRRNVLVQMDLQKGLPEVDVDPVQIEQVLLNLALNGMDAMMEIEEPRRLVLVSKVVGDREIAIRVEDCGTGLDPETAPKIFDPFFTTKTGGMGMGLAISRSIVEAHEGRLTASPRPLGGAVFQVTIPLQS